MVGNVEKMEKDIIMYHPKVTIARDFIMVG